MLEVRLLGQCSLTIDERPLSMPSRPARLLLAYLVLNPGTRHSRDHLASLLWPDSTSENARSNLRHTLWRLRSILEEAGCDEQGLIVDDETIMFDTACLYWLDVAVLEQPVDRTTDVKRLAAQLDVYEGELLPGYYDSWVVLERERIEAVVDLRMQALLARLSAAQEWRAVIAWAERWIALGEFPEPAYRYLMQAHLETGNVGRAAAAFDRCRVAMAQEMGAEPSPQTLALAERIGRPSSNALLSTPPSKRAGPSRSEQDRESLSDDQSDLWRLAQQAETMQKELALLRRDLRMLIAAILTLLALARIHFRIRSAK